MTEVWERLFYNLTSKLYGVHEPAPTQPLPLPPISYSQNIEILIIPHGSLAIKPSPFVPGKGRILFVLFLVLAHFFTCIFLNYSMSYFPLQIFIWNHSLGFLSVASISLQKAFYNLESFWLAVFSWLLTTAPSGCSSPLYRGIHRGSDIVKCHQANCCQDSDSGI